MTPIEQRQELLEIQYPKAIRDLTSALNDQTKWNFVVRYFAREAITSIDRETFFEWIRTPDQLFGEINQPNGYPTFAVPDAVSTQFSRVHALARQILLPSHENTERYKQTLLDQFKRADIHSTPPEQVVNEFLTNINNMMTLQLRITDPEDQRVLIEQLSALFSEKGNQILSDEEVGAKIKAMFEILQGDPRISAGKFAQQIKSFWVFPRDEAQRILINLSELFVKYNPYNKTVEDFLFDAIENSNTMQLMNKSLIYRLPHSPFSLKIDRVVIEEGRGVIRGIKFISPEGLTTRLRINTQTREITSLKFDRLTQTPMDIFIEGHEYSKPFQVETKIPIPGIKNPFQLNKNYIIEVRTGREGIVARLGIGKDYTDYIFQSADPSKPHTIKFHVVRDSREIEIEDSKDRSKSRQEIHWNTYQSLFIVLTEEEENYTTTQTGEKKLDPRLISLSEKPLATEGAVKKALKEKDQFKAEILVKLIESYHENDRSTLEAFDFINSSENYQISSETHDGLPERLFNALFSNDNILFHKLCNNQYIKANYHIEERSIFTLPLKRKFAFDLLHEAQALILAYIQPKDQMGNHDLIKQLCIAANLARPMQDVFAIPFIGPTGSGKSTTVNYMMGVPMEEFEDIFGEKRIKQKEEVGGIPKIGFALGLSETIHANSFSLLPPPPFRADPRNPYARPPRHDPEFRNGLTRENLKLADFPGFFDTRGTNYEIITNFSIDRAMEAFRGIPALVQVIPYENIIADRAGVLLSTLKDLETKFPNLLHNQELQKRVYFVITKFNDVGIEQLKARLEQLVNEYRADRLVGAKYFEFLLNQLLTGKVHLLNPLSATKKLDIFNSIISTFEIPSERSSDPVKQDYQGGFKEVNMQLRIGDVLHGAILCWNNLLTGFLEQKEKIRTIEEQIIHINREIETGRIDLDGKSETLRQLVSKENQPVDLNDPLYANFENSSRATRAKYARDIDSLSSEINQLSATVNQNVRAIEALELTITELGTGSIEDKIYDRVITRGSQERFKGTWARGVDVEAKIRRQIDAGANDLSDHEGEVEGQPFTYTAGTDKWHCSRSIVIHKKYELVPNDLSEAEKERKLNELAGGVGFRSVILDDGTGWRIDLESEGEIRFIGNIRMHDSGKKFLYGYHEVCNLNPPYPKLVITAKLPKSVYNRVAIEEKRGEIEKLRNQNIEKRQRLALKEGTKSEYETQLNRLKTEFQNNATAGLQRLISQARTQLDTAGQRLNTKQSELAGENRRKKEANLKLRKFAVSIHYNKEIIEGTHTCCQSFRPIESDHLDGTIRRKGEEVLAICDAFVQLCDTRMAEIHGTIHQILA